MTKEYYFLIFWIELFKELLNKVPELEIRIDNVGPVIGAHCGPGTLAICFMGKHRPY